MEEEPMSQSPSSENNLREFSPFENLLNGEEK